MADSPLKRCTSPGCRALVRSPDSRCPQHKREHQRDADRRRGSARQRGYSSRWDRASKAFLARPGNELCVECLKQDKVVASQCTDHIIPHNGNQELFWDENNWQPLCLVCNSRKGNRPA